MYVTSLFSCMCPRSYCLAVAICAQIPVRLLPSTAPRITTLLQLMAAHPPCLSCNFYRNELPPIEGTGPPYGLLQGTLLGMTSLPPCELHLPVR
jgi:hypothetical protein